MTAQRKKILFMITKSVWGGAGRYVYDLARDMTRDHDVVVACGGNGPLVKKLGEADIRTIEIVSFQRDINITKEFRSFFELFGILRRERPDIVHLNSSKAGGTGAFTVRLYNLFSTQKARIVFTAHGWAFKEERPTRERFLIKLLSFITVVFAHKVIVVSDDDLHRALWMPLVKKKFSVIHNGIEIPEFLPKETARAEIAKKLSNKAVLGDIWIGAIAELHRNKGLIYALRAMEGLTEETATVRLIIIGEGEEREEIENLIVAKELENRVFLVGQISDAATYLKAFDVFMLPSIKEGLPYTILEAGAAALPVVATAVGGISEIIQDMHSGVLVRAKDAAELTGALKLCIEDTERANAFGAALHEHVADNFSLEGMARATRHVYGEAGRHE